jgi:hypothetical protein
MNTSVALFVSPAIKLEALLSNKTNWPFVAMATGHELSLPPPVPSKLTLTRVVVAATRSRRYTLNGGEQTDGIGVFVRISTRLLAVLAKSTYLPSGLIIGANESPIPPSAGPDAGCKTETSCSG